MRSKKVTVVRDKVNIRIATLDDIKQLVNLRILEQRGKWGSEYNDFDNNFYSRTLNALKDFLNWKGNIPPSKGIIYIAEKDGKIVATCGLQKIWMLPQCNDEGRYGFIFNVYTMKEYRSRGIQSLLIKAVIGYAKQIGITAISIEADNEIAVKLCEKHGFKLNSFIMTKEG